jgi:hypothetical protein
MPLPTALEKVLATTQTRLCARSEQGSLVLGALFWKCFLKGGVQGGIYLIDTARKYLAEKRSLSGILQREGAPC